MLRLTLRVCKRIARSKEIRIQSRTTEARERDLAAVVRGLERAAKRIAGVPMMLGPGQDEVAVVQIGPRPKAGQATPFCQLEADIAEANPRLIVAEQRA